MTAGRCAGLVILGTVLAAFAAGAAEIGGAFTVGAGYLDNPLGIAGESSAAYASQRLRLNTIGHHGRDDFRLGYELEASQFGNDTELGSLRHALGWEWWRRDDDSPGSFGLGIQGAVRRYREAYSYYDYGEGNFYTVWRTFPASSLLLKAVGTFRLRSYDDLPEESYLEPRLDVQLKRFFASRTTVGLETSLGLKHFYDSAASRVWETPHLPSTSQLAARLNLSQGVSDRVGMRAWVEQRFSLEGFPHYVGEDVYDSPLLDFYAHEGTDALAAVKWLSPLLFWVEGGFAWGDHDYGDMLFADDGAGALRQDMVRDWFVSCERSLKIGAKPAKFRVQAGWRNQDSTLGAYNLDGGWFNTSLTCSF